MGGMVRLRRICLIALAVCALRAVAVADPAADTASPRAIVEAAIQRLADVDNCTWDIYDSSGFDRRPLALFLPGRLHPVFVSMPGDAISGLDFPIRGKWQRDGLAAFSVESGYRNTRKSAQAFTKAGKIVVGTADGWRTASQIPIPDNQFLSQKDPAPFAVLMAQYFNFGDEASYLLKNCRNLRVRKDFYTGFPAEVYAGDLKDDEADKLIPPPPRPGDDYLAMNGPKVTVTFVIKDGLFVEFEIEAKLKDDSGIPLFFNRTTSVSMSEVGYTTIVLPDEAVAPLGLSEEAIARPGNGKVVGLDYYYNHQVRDGRQVGCTWENEDDDGYSKFGDIWKQDGATLARLEKSSTRQDLDHFSVYIIASPSTVQNGADHHLNYIESDAIDAIASWVQDGGVLAIFANAKDDCEFDHLNRLAGRFGFTFNGDRSSTAARSGGTTTVDGQSVSMGTESVRFSGYPIGLYMFPDHVLFKDVQNVYLKEMSTLTVGDSAKILLVDNRWWPFQHPVEEPRQWYEYFGLGRSLVNRHPKVGFLKNETLIAVRRLGKGLVFAVGSPWFNNGNIDAPQAGDPSGNRQAAENLANWLLTASSAPVKKDAKY
jgi:hypothetical protein